MQKTIFILFFLIGGIVTAQNDSIAQKNGIDKISFLATHHFGMFSARINQNFREKPVIKNRFEFSIASGNTFHPYLETYLPEDPAIREQFSNTIWHDRRFDYENNPADYYNIVVDAVFKEFRLAYTFKLSEKSDLQITSRSFITTEGNYPLSFFTSDETIEWFHSNIAGGHDAFGRRYYGLNQVNVRYLDRNGRLLELNKNQFVFAGLDMNYHYYLDSKKLNEKNIFINLGGHLGINTSKYNASTDVGASINSHKLWKSKNGQEFRFGLGAAVLRKNLIDFNENNIQLGTNDYLGSFETMFEWTKYTRKKNYHSFGVNYQLQTAYNKTSEADYYFLLGKWQEINAGWHNGAATLSLAMTSWNFSYTYGHRNFALSLYLKEDLDVNNAPDLQTGIGIVIPFSN